MRMPAVRARALLSATRPRLSTAPRRTFRCSAAARNGRPGDANNAPTAKPDDKASEKQAAAVAADSSSEKSSEPKAQSPSETVTPAPPVDGFKETLRSQGYGSARARASRRPVEEVPPLVLPEWFKTLNVSLAEERVANWKGSEMMPLEEEDQEQLVGFLDRLIDSLLDFSADRLSLDDIESTVNIREKLQKTTDLAYTASLYQVLALAYHRGAPPERFAQFRQIFKDSKAHISTFDEPRARQSPVTPSARRWLANVRSDEGPDPSKVYGNPLGSRPGQEYEACIELLATIHAELIAKPPQGKQARDLNRPVNVLSVMNHKGPSVAWPVINDVATALKADVVHLDAWTLGQILGVYLGQVPHWNRGGLLSLGYSVAELNGRLGASREESDMVQAMNTITVSFPSRIRSMMPKRDGFGLGLSASDERWDDLKLNQALEIIVSAADDKRKAQGLPRSSSEDLLIIHVHEFIEINASNENILTKLRAIIDRKFQNGRKVILVGSSASDVRSASSWRYHVVDAAREDCNIIPFHSSATAEGRNISESIDNYRQNLKNIVLVLETVSGTKIYEADFDFHIDVVDGKLVAKDDLIPDDLFRALCESVRDATWCRRLVSALIGFSWHKGAPAFARFKREDLINAFEFLSERDRQWAEVYPGAQAPHYTPTTRSSLSSFLSGGPEEWQPDAPNLSSSSSSMSSNKNYDQYEKKLMTGLVDPNDLHTTFNDIVLPANTKESVINLTTLSIVRPEAFSYGVLKTERIPGCLLYGPPGTGKTLLAKAVAKESGAKMIEVSAASINDMYVGNSEKNVRALFSLARKMAPVVIFLDEADALLGARSGRPGRASHREVMTQFLREWDGLKDMRAFIMVATNRPFDLDEAVLRRLPRKILVDLPLKEQREAILRVMLQDEELDSSVDLTKLAADTELYSGSDLKNLCVAAAMEAVREETRAKDAHVGSEPFVFPEKRTLTAAHFAKGLREISASISEDMDSLKAIRKFDERYGDSGRKKKGKRTMGFGASSDAPATEEARVRQGTAAAAAPSV